MLSPIVYWGQTSSTISLRVDLKHTKNPIIEVKESDLHFEGLGIGACGQKDYMFNIRFFEPIESQDSFYRVNDRHVEFVLKKRTSKVWPRLLESSEKPGWLKVDFDKLGDSSEDTDNDESIDDWQRASQLADYLRKGRFETDPGVKKTRMSPEDIRKVYLFLYNLFQMIGFTYLFVALLLRQWIEGSISVPGSYQAISTVIKLVHFLKTLEILHPILGFTTGDVLYPSLEVFYRLFMIIFMIEGELRIQTKPVVFYLLLTWSLNDIIRHLYYMLRTFDADSFLKYIYYNIWMVTYPLSFVFEGVILLRNIPFFDETNNWSFDLPNHWNIAFSMASLIRLFLLFGFFPSSCMQITRMYNKRKYRIGRKKKLD